MADHRISNSANPKINSKVESFNWDGAEIEVEIVVEDLNVLHQAVYAFPDEMKAYSAGLADVWSPPFALFRQKLSRLRFYDYR